MVTQELIYNLPLTTLGADARDVQRVPLTKDIVGFGIHLNAADDAVGAMTWEEDATEGVVVKIRADTEEIYLPARLMRILMERFYKISPVVTTTDGAATVISWFWMIPVNISKKNFVNVEIELDLSACTNFAADMTACIAIVYGDAIENTFLTIARNQYAYAGAGTYQFTSPNNVELVDIYLVNNDADANEFTVIVFKAGTERVYDFNKMTAKIFTAIDTKLGLIHLTDEDRVLITINPSIVGTDDVTLDLTVTGACTAFIYWLVRKVVAGKA